MKKNMNKKKLVNFALPIFLIGFVVAALVYSVTLTGTVDASFVTSGLSDSSFADVNGGETITTGVFNALSQTSVNVPLGIENTYDPDDGEVSSTVFYHLDNTGGSCPGDTCERRVVVTGEDSVSDFSSLTNIEWDVREGSGYAPHVDIFLDNGESLTFEYAKTDPLDCDDSGDYPTGEFNTFADKGIVDSSAYAWETIPGACGDSSFDAQHKSLDDWQTTYPDAKILRFEFEVDNWISESSAELSNILINGASVEVTLLPEDDLDLEVEHEFSLSANSTYEITTELTPRQ